jgi:hypothetical protein
MPYTFFVPAAIKPGGSDATEAVAVVSLQQCLMEVSNAQSLIQKSKLTYQSYKDTQSVHLNEYL